MFTQAKKLAHLLSANWTGKASGIIHPDSKELGTRNRVDDTCIHLPDQNPENQELCYLSLSQLRESKNPHFLHVYGPFRSWIDCLPTCVKVNFLSLSIQMIMFPETSSKIHWAVMFYQFAGHQLAQSSWYIKLSIKKINSYLIITLQWLSQESWGEKRKI